MPSVRRLVRLRWRLAINAVFFKLGIAFTGFGKVSVQGERGTSLKGVVSSSVWPGTADERSAFGS